MHMACPQRYYDPHILKLSWPECLAHETHDPNAGPMTHEELARWATCFPMMTTHTLQGQVWSRALFMMNLLYLGLTSGVMVLLK